MRERIIKPAIVAVGYNRPDSMRRLLSSVEMADYPVDDIELIISIDKSNNQNEVVRVAEETPWSHGSKVIRAFDERQGLRKHILQCGDLSQKYGAVIILEDDLLVSPSFYHYTFQAVNHYYNDDHICGIALYRHSWNGYAHLPFLPAQNEYDAFLGQFSITWGQCWTDRQWRQFKCWYLEHEDRLPKENPCLPAGILKWGNQSWGKYFVSYVVETNKYYVVPYTAMSTNFSEVGQHNAVVGTSHQVPILTGVKKQYSLPAFDAGIKYDVFFERVFPKDTVISGIRASEICINLNGTKSSTLGKQYVLSTHLQHVKPIASFGISMRPIEENIIQNTAGNDIHLYQAETDELKVNIKKPGDVRAAYELYGFFWRTLTIEGIRRCFSSISKKIKKVLKN